MKKENIFARIYIYIYIYISSILIGLALISSVCLLRKFFGSICAEVKLSSTQLHPAISASSGPTDSWFVNRCWSIRISTLKRLVSFRLVCQPEISMNDDLNKRENISVSVSLILGLTMELATSHQRWRLIWTNEVLFEISRMSKIMARSSFVLSFFSGDNERLWNCLAKFLGSTELMKFY